MAGQLNPIRVPSAKDIARARGTDIVSSFAGSGPTTVVRRGYLSAPSLGVTLESWDMASRSVRNEVGELVVTAPMPSMPTRFRGDVDGSRYRSSYFDTYPGYGATETGSPSPTITR
jgi:acetoacetyl-CoA synthetase